MMASPRRAVPLVTVGLLAGALALGGCNASASKGGSAAGGSSGGNGGPALILVTPEPVGVNDFLKLAVKGVEDAARTAGGTSKVFQSQDATAVQQQLDAAVAERPGVVTAVGFEFADALAAAAKAHPDQQFLFVDACTTDTLPNVTCAVFREHEAVYLAGIEAGMLTKSGKVGAVVALDTPQIRRYADPFGAGAQHAKPGVTSTPLFVGGQSPFNDPARAKEQALSLVAQGADEVMAASAAGNLGVFDAAKGGQFQAFGVDVNQCGQAPGHVVDNVVKRVDTVEADALGKILGGAKGGQVVSYGLKEHGISLTGLEDDVASSGCLIADRQDVLSAVKTARDQIVAGSLTVQDPAQG
jgi:basic membrane protein A